MLLGARLEAEEQLPRTAKRHVLASAARGAVAVADAKELMRALGEIDERRIVEEERLIAFDEHFRALCTEKCSECRDFSGDEARHRHPVVMSSR